MINDLLIIAAGMGSRLKARGDLKPLVEVGGVSLIEHAIGAAMAAGLSRVTVVTGHKATKLERFLEALAARRGWHIQTVHNTDFRKPNGLSVLCARQLMKGRFCLAMCDHLVTPSLYRRLLAAEPRPGQVALAVDRRLDNPCVDLSDVTRVQLAGRQIRDIGKEIAIHNAFDTGVFAADPALFKALEDSGYKTGDFSLSGGIRHLAANKRAIGVDIGDAFWIDVDSPEMHALATEWLATSGRATAPRSTGHPVSAP